MDLTAATPQTAKPATIQPSTLFTLIQQLAVTKASSSAVYTPQRMSSLRPTDKQRLTCQPHILVVNATNL